MISLQPLSQYLSEPLYSFISSGKISIIITSNISWYKKDFRILNDLNVDLNNVMALLLFSWFFPNIAEKAVAGYLWFLNLSRPEQVPIFSHPINHTVLCDKTEVKSGLKLINGVNPGLC